MKKFTAYLLATLCVVALAACSSGSGEGGPDYNSPDYGQVTITHSNRSYDKIPSFNPAVDITGTITWSDGETEEWKQNVKHLYTGASPFKVTYDLWKAETVQFNDLTGLAEIDFSKF